MVLVSLQWIKGYQFFDATGNPLAAGTINIYDSGTTSLRTTYSDNGGTVANTLNGSNAIVLDSGGKLDESVYIPTGLWKYILKDSGGVPVDDGDALLGALDTSVFLTGSVTAETPVITKSADYPIVNGDQTKVINANPTGGSFTLTLPSAITVGDGWRITIKNVGTANQVNIATVSAQTIDGQSSAALTVYLEALTLVSDGANWHVADTANPAVVARMQVAAGSGFSIIGGNLIASVSSNILTVAIKTSAGNDPSAFAPVKILFRGQAAADEEFSVITITAATSLAVPDTALLGTTNSTAFRLWFVGFNDGGTFRLGVINCLSTFNVYPLGQFPLASSTAVGTGSDSAHVFYTGSAVSSKPYRILGYATWESGLATAGTWSAAPTRFQLFGPGVPLPGARVQTAYTSTTTQASTTSATFVNLTSGQTLAITPTSAANVIEASSTGTLANVSNATQSIQLVRGTTLIGFPVQSGISTNSVASGDATFVRAFDAPGVSSSTTYQVQGKTNAGTLLYPITGTGADITLHEIMA